MKNIPENTTTEELKEIFQQHGEVTKVVMPPAKAGGKRDFGFIHYAERSSALKAVKETEKYEINGLLKSLGYINFRLDQILFVMIMIHKKATPLLFIFSNFLDEE